MLEILNFDNNFMMCFREKRESHLNTGLRRMESNGALDHVRPGDPWSAAGGLTDALHPESASCTSKEKIGGPQERPILQSQRRCYAM